MINIDTIEQEILDLEKKDTTYAVIERLAWLYIVRDHIATEKEDQRSGSFVGSEFAEACSGVPMDSLMNVLSEHMEQIHILYPRAYNDIIIKIKALR